MHPLFMSILIGICVSCKKLYSSSNQSDIRSRSEHALELHSRAVSSVGVLYRSSGPNTGRNPGGGRILLKKKNLSEPSTTWQFWQVAVSSSDEMEAPVPMLWLWWRWRWTVSGFDKNFHFLVVTAWHGWKDEEVCLCMCVPLQGLLCWDFHVFLITLLGHIVILFKNNETNSKVKRPW